MRNQTITSPFPLPFTTQESLLQTMVPQLIIGLARLLLPCRTLKLLWYSTTLLQSQLPQLVVLPSLPIWNHPAIPYVPQLEALNTVSTFTRDSL